MDGILLADKPAGISSHDVVSRVRRALGTRRVGHAGTLDPFATGLLIMLVGRATRTQRFFMDLPKTYEVQARLGARSTTGDPEGEIEQTGRFPARPLQLPLGEQQQRPPAYSAVHIDGERAYKRARRGEDVEIPERTVNVYEFSELASDETEASFRIRCSSGTYVRSLIADLGDAYCLQLRRTAIGPFSVQGAWHGEGRPHVLELGEALGALIPVLALEHEQAQAVAHGRALDPLPDEGPVLLCDDDGPIAIAQNREERLRVVVGFRA